MAQRLWACPSGLPARSVGLFLRVLDPSRVCGLFIRSLTRAGFPRTSSERHSVARSSFVPFVGCCPPRVSLTQTAKLYFITDDPAYWLSVAFPPYTPSTLYFPGKASPNYCYSPSPDAAPYSLAGTCKLNVINPFTWMKDTLEKIAQYPINRIGELLPHKYKAILYI